jgi:hypothetical protein
MSVVDLHRFVADLDPDPAFHFDADTDLDWHQNTADPYADLAPSYTQVGKLGNIFYFVLSNTSLQCFEFLISGKCVLSLGFWIAY